MCGGSEPRSKEEAQLPTSVISLPPSPSPFLPSLPHLPSFLSEMLLFACIIVADPPSSLPHGLRSPDCVCLLLREVYRVTESLQREKSGLLKQLDFLRWVCQGLLPCLYSGTTLISNGVVLSHQDHQPKNNDTETFVFISYKSSALASACFELVLRA